MPRTTPRDPPPTDAVAATVGRRLDERVVACEPFANGLNAVYRVAFADAPPAVAKLATFSTDAELRVEGRLLERLAAAGVPVPTHHGTVLPADHDLSVAVLLTAFVPGRRLTDLRAFSRRACERLFVAAGRHLAAIHAPRIADEFGPLAHAGGDGDGLTATGAGDWPTAFRRLVADLGGRLAGDGYTTDDRPRLADLAPRVTTRLRAAVGDDWDATPALLTADYRPANLVFGPDDDARPLVRAVVDVGDGPAGDGLLDLALAEHALVTVPFTDEDRRADGRSRLRTAYRRGGGREFDPDGDRYTAYRLYAVARRAAGLDYWAQFAPESEPAAVADRVRRRIDRLCRRLA